MTSDTDPRGCSKVVDVLADYLENKLPAARHRELDQHLSACDNCVAQLRTYRATISLLRELSDEDLPPELRSSVVMFLSAQETS